MSEKSSKPAKREARFDSSIAAAVRQGYLYTLGVLALGVLLLVWPRESVEVAIYAAAGLVILMGLVRVIRYFRVDPVTAREQQLLAGGTVRIVLGILMLLYNTNAREWLPGVCGAVMLVIGGIRLQAAFDLKRRGMENWYAVLGAAAVSLILGVVALLFRKSLDSVLMLGAALCVEALGDFYSRLKFAAIERKERREAEAPAAETKPKDPPSGDKEEESSSDDTDAKKED